MIRIDITYPHGMHVGEQFPPAPSTLFQGVVAANGHQLDSAATVLEAFERSSCVRIVQRSETKPISILQAVPRLPKISEIKQMLAESTESQEKLMKPQTYFPLKSGQAQLSYYFDLDGHFPIEQLNEVLQIRVLGRGESVTKSHVFSVDRLPIVENGTVFEPGENGREMQVPYPGFLENLRMLHNAGQSSFTAPKKKQRFAQRTTVTVYGTICYDLFDIDGETFSCPQANMSDISAMARHAVMAAMRGKCDPAYVSGHTSRHPFYLPLPTIGHEYADGNIRRLIIAEPAGCEVLHENLQTLTCLNLVNEHGKLVCRAMRRTDTDNVLKQYLTPCNIWRTVTPMVIDRAGGPQRVTKRINALLQKSGYPEPVRISFNRTWWNGKLPVTCRRMVAHVAVEFPVPEAGPVFAGLAGGYGIGLFYANQACL